MLTGRPVSELSEKTPDRRTLKTKKALRESLAEILTEKELHRVTVQEIADKADVNRVTFYKHYLDVYDLYDKIEQEVLVEIGLVVLKLEELPTDKLFSQLLDYIDDNRPVFVMMFSPNCTGTLRGKLVKCLEGLFRQTEAEKHSADVNDTKLCYRTCYRSQGCVAVISRWVQGGFAEPKDLIVKILTELDLNTEKLIGAVLAAKRPVSAWN